MPGWEEFADAAPRIAEVFCRADIVDGASVAVGGGHMDVTMWREGGTERVVRKH